MITAESKVTEIFCIADDFCKFDGEMGSAKNGTSRPQLTLQNGKA